MGDTKRLWRGCNLVMDIQIQCPYCKNNITETDYFCPNCGKKLKNKPLATDLLKQLSIYLISFLLPPFGLWPAVKYLRQPDSKAKNIGLAALVITVISLVISIYISARFINVFNANINDQVKMYQDLGF